MKRDTNTPGFMRAPDEVPSFRARELRSTSWRWAARHGPGRAPAANDTPSDPITTSRPSSRARCAQCFRRGARAFGWNRRIPQPGAMREGDWLVGFGCATATYPTHIAPCRGARVQLAGQRHGARRRSPPQDIGTGTYTIAAQVAAEELGLPYEAVSVELGDSALPTGPVAGGSRTAGAVASAIRQRLARASATSGRSLAARTAVRLAEGPWRRRAGRRSLRGRRRPGRHHRGRPGRARDVRQVLPEHARAGDEDPRHVRLRRRVRGGAGRPADRGRARAPHGRRVRAGRILNPRTARASSWAA